MSQEEEIYKEVKFKWVGALDLKILYEKLNRWLQDEDFVVKEKSYVEKIKPLGKQLEIVWDCKYKRTEYFHWKVELIIYSINVNEVEVEREGKKIKLHQGQHQIRFKGTLIMNASDEFIDESFMHKFYKRFIMTKKIEEEMIELFKVCHALVQEIKSYLEVFQLE